jgi:uncharacterized protein
VILYLDTSNLAKLYLAEEGSADVEEAALAAEAVTSSKIAYVETRVALARAFRDRRIDERILQATQQKFEGEWPGLAAVEVSDFVLREAADLGDRHPVRASDAVHLASALQVRDLNRQEVLFSTSDRRLRDAAIAEGLSV